MEMVPVTCARACAWILTTTGGHGGNLDRADVGGLAKSLERSVSRGLVTLGGVCRVIIG